MDSMSALESAGLALQVQATMQRKVMDYQAENFLKLLEGLDELREKMQGGKNDSLGKIVDVIA
ncbi:MAG: hypothetical protein JXQ83_03595 [Candidatus Glassbacteria bacterium]|nr:hypothetical protein [Candidatus Glassbacteria bacterium]